MTPWLSLALAVMAAIAPFLLVKAGGEDLIAWRTDLEQALAESKRDNKPVLIDVTADWCPPCVRMKKWTFPEARVKQFVESNYIPMRLDVTDKNSPANVTGARFKIRYLPTFIVLSPDGTEIRRESGGMDADQFLAWLKNEE